jgi:methionyl aminopeptidase
LRKIDENAQKLRLKFFNELCDPKNRDETSANLLLYLLFSQRSFSAGVVKLADARDSKSRDRKVVRVRLPPPAPAFARSLTSKSVTLPLMCIESQADFDGICRVGRVVAETVRAIELATRVGITTRELDEIGAAVLKKHSARSAPQLVYGCPTVNLISVNDEIVHGLPGPRRIRSGDVVKIDVTAELDGYIADAATTVAVPPASETGNKLKECAAAAFAAGCSAAKAGRLVSDIGRAVEGVVRSYGFDVIRELSGHGVGRMIHEEPTVKNYYDPRQRDVLTEGLVLTIEPLITAGPSRLRQDRDGWTLRTHNGTLAAHYEHTVIVTRGAPVIVTSLSRSA